MPKNPKDSVEEDQKERGYYYDDSHGYEKFEPEDDDDRDAENDGRGDGEIDDEHKLGTEDEDESTKGAM